MNRIRASIAMAILVAFGLLAGCGESSDPAADRRDVEATVMQMQKDLQAKDLRGVCDALAPAAQRQIGKAGHGTPSGCVTDLSEMLDLVGTTIRDKQPSVTRVEVDGDEATAVLSVNGRPTTGVPFERQDGEWKVVNFFGADTLPPKFVFATPSQPATYPTVPAVARQHSGDGVSLVDGGAPCGVVKRSGDRLSGGCTGRVAGGRFDMSVRTPIGAFPMALHGCIPKGDLRVAGDGRFWLEKTALMEPVRKNPCADNRPCTSSEGVATAWEGQLYRERASRLVGYVNVCVATCVGRFKGKVPVALVRKDGAWRLRFEDSPLGGGGMTVDGDAITRGFETLDARAT